MLSLLDISPVLFVYDIIAIVVAIAIHECAHAYSAEKLGDPTPRLQSRVSLNPLRHLDLFGFMFILFTQWGWGKPVQFDPFNLKNPRRDAAIISIAGPISNIILAVICAIIARILPEGFLPFLIVMMAINIRLAIFNLVPIHPLDGFKIVGGILPSEKAHEWYQLERYGLLFLLFLIIPFGQRSMLSSLLGPPVDFILNILIPHTTGSGVI